MIEAECDYCGKSKKISYQKYNKSTKNQTEKYACSECASVKAKENGLPDRRNIYYKAFEEKCKELGFTPISTINDYFNAYSVMEYICPVHGLKHSKYNDFIHSKTGCYECGFDSTKNNLSLNSEKVKELVESKNNNILLNPNDYINYSTNNLRVICGSCKKQFTTSLSSISNSGGRCHSCGYEYEKTALVLPINEVEQRININGNVLLNPNEYIGNDVRNLSVMCSCGNIFTTSLVDYEYFKVNRCSFCSKSISKGEL